MFLFGVIYPYKHSKLNSISKSHSLSLKKQSIVKQCSKDRVLVNILSLIPYSIYITIILFNRTFNNSLIFFSSLSLSAKAIIKLRVDTHSNMSTNKPKQTKACQ